MLLTAEYLGFSYQALRLFRDLSFQLCSGQVLHLKGANGSGKTTLLEILAGLRHLQKGHIQLYDQKKRTLLDIKKNLEYLAAETNGLYLNLNALENYCFWAKLRGSALSISEVKEQLATWGFRKDFFLKYLEVEKFSTGMKRRLSLARSFGSQANLLLLDEPTAGLDEEGCTHFQAAVEECKKQGKMIILVSHDIGSVSHLIDTTVMLKAIKN